MYAYSVRMKRVTATDARKNWFRLLDEVAAGEVVVIERKGRRLVLRRDDERDDEAVGVGSDYSELIDVPDVHEADEWGWRWPGPEEDVIVAGEEEGAEAAEESEG